MRHLEGITVIEFGEYVTAPSAARYLSEWGARVIKVERPEGDRQRKQGQSFGMRDFTQMEYNHNLDMMCGGQKEYISVNTKTVEGLAVLHRLLESADVFLTNMRPKALKKMGLDYETLSQRYPSLVYAIGIGYGDKGEFVDAPGYDAICYSARGGIMAGFPQKGDAPANVPLGFGDLQAGSVLAAGICGALLGRVKTGKGDRVCVSLYHTALYMNTMGVVAGNEPYNNAYPRSRLDLPNPLNNTYQCKDGKWLLICEPVYNLAIKKVLNMLGRADLQEDPLWTDLTRIQAEGRMREASDIIAESFTAKDRDEWIRIFKEQDVPGGPCFDFVDIGKDAFAWENDFLRTIHYPDGLDGVVVDLPVRFASQGLSPLARSKHCGADTLETLKTYGYTQEQLDRLKACGAIATEGMN